MRQSFYSTFFRCISLWMLFIVLTSCRNDLSLQTHSIEVTKSPGRTEVSIPKQQPTTLINTVTPRVTPTFIPESPLTQFSNESIWIRRDNWTSANQIRTMLVDHSGNLWAGGPGGVVHWDLITGLSTSYVIEANPEESNVVSLAQTSDKALWIGTFGNGISRIDPVNRWQTYTTKSGLPSDYIASILSESNGSIWIDTSPFARDQDALGRGYLGLFNGRSWTPGTGGGFFRIVSSPEMELWAIVRMQIGQRWESYISVFREEKWETVNIGEKNESLTAITVAPDGKLWVAGKTGVFIFDGNAWNKINPPWKDNPVANVSSVEVTKSGAAWFGFSVGAGVFGDECGDRMTNTEEIGVYRYDGQSWTHFSDKYGLLDNKVCDIALDQDGNILFGTFDKGISLYDGMNWTSLVVKDG